MQKVTWTNLLRVGGALLSLLVAAVAASHSLGGPVSVVGVKGASMQPALHAGDAVIVWRDGSYASGDVVAYRSARLDALVLHRVVEKRGNGYVVKGDNNDWLDPETASSGTVLGRQVVRVPFLGTIIGSLSTPMGILMVSIFAVMVPLASRRSRHRKRARVEGGHPGINRRGILLIVSGTSAIACAAAGIFAFTTPSTGPTSARHSYSHSGEFAYTTRTARSVAYPSGLVTTGDPVFRKLVRDLDVSFAYELETPSDHDVSGRAVLSAAIGDGLGWTHEVPLSRPVHINDPRTTLKGSLDLQRVQDIIDEMEATTGLSTSTYTVELVAKVELTGDIAGTSFDSAFAPRFPLSLDHIRLQPAADPTPQDGVDPIRPSVTEAVEVAGSPQGESSIAGLSRRTVAWMSALGFVLSLLAAAVVFSPKDPASDADEAEVIRSALRRDLIAIDPGSTFSDGLVIDVASARAFIDLAARFDVVLASTTARGTEFFVQDRLTRYRYVCSNISCDVVSTPAADEAHDAA